MLKIAKNVTRSDVITSGWKWRPVICIACKNLHLSSTFWGK